MKTISIITPIPDMINSIIEQSILRKAIEGDVVKFDLVDLRDYGLGNYKQIDDTPYGGGGGMILTNDKKLAKKAKYLSTQATDDSIRYIHNDIGYNYRLTNIQAAVGLAQLEKINLFLKKKGKI